MRNLSKRLWTSKHDAEVRFNRDKHHKKELKAFQTGTHLPTTALKKRKLEKELKKFQQAEKKRRKNYEASTSRRCSAANKQTN